jgi:hypothetical protein
MDYQNSISLIVAMERKPTIKLEAISADRDIFSDKANWQDWGAVSILSVVFSSS